jgi:hypothetical protein
VEAQQSVAREIALEAVAEQLEVEVSNEEIEAVLREQGESDETIAEVMASNLPRVDSRRPAPANGPDRVAAEAADLGRPRRAISDTWAGERARGDNVDPRGKE